MGLSLRKICKVKKTMSITAIRGFNDILPARSRLFSHMESEARRFFSLYGFDEIRLPILEKTELFKRTIGDTTDIVEKQMYTFSDLKGESLTLRPEATAPVARAFIENKLYTSPVTKLFYCGPMFRYERPQKGRYRQFHQIGAEVMGEDSPLSDAETIEMLWSYLKELGIESLELEINSLGCGECRPAFKESLTGFLSNKSDLLCDNCQRRIEKNPLRALDCKSAHCKDATAKAPSTLDFLCTSCVEHFDFLKEALGRMEVPATVNTRMVRGLDYYTKTAFEITTNEGLGAQNAVAAGGRYDSLIKDLGGPEVPCFGFAIGVERLSLVVDEAVVPDNPLIVFIAMGEEAERHASKSQGPVAALRRNQASVLVDFSRGNLKSRMKRADRLKASYVLILGEDELKDGTITLKDMNSGEQARIDVEEAIIRLTDGSLQEARL